MWACLVVTKEEVHGLTQVFLELQTRELLVVCFARVSRVHVGFVRNRRMALAVLRAVVKSNGSALAHAP